jgi:hypothetical protein
MSMQPPNSTEWYTISACTHASYIPHLNLYAHLRDLDSERACRYSARSNEEYRTVLWPINVESRPINVLLRSLM